MDTGCSRCLHLGLVCKFHDKGIPGRPRKWSLVEPREQRCRQDSDLQKQSHLTTSPSTVFAEGPSSVATSGSRSTDLLPAAPPPPQDWTSRDRHEEMVFSGDEFGTLPFLDFNTTGQLDSLPLESFRACLSNVGPNGNPTEPEPLSSNSTSVTQTTPPQLQSCDCAKQVFDIIRLLKRDLVSHSTVHILRQGTDLFERLLTCPVCYDVSKPPRVTLQNVLLLGRLSLEVTTGYQQYLKWLKDYCSGLAEREMGDTVYLIPGIDVSSALGFRISSDKFYDIVTEGLQSDAERLSDLGRQFAVRQHNRHLIGHGACPDSEGRCWKDKDDVDPDPSDVCPQSAAARALIPCYRVVDEVRSKIRQFEDAVK